MLAAIGASQEIQQKIIQWQMSHLPLGSDVNAIMVDLAQQYQSHLAPLPREYGLPEGGLKSFCRAMDDYKVPELDETYLCSSTKLVLFDLEVFAANITIRVESEDQRKRLIEQNLDTLVPYCEKHDYAKIGNRMPGLDKLFYRILFVASPEQKQRIIEKQSRESLDALHTMLSDSRNRTRFTNAGYAVDETLAALSGKLSPKKEARSTPQATLRSFFFAQTREQVQQNAAPDYLANRDKATKLTQDALDRATEFERAFKK